MAARIIDGKTLAAQVKARVRDGVEDCKRQGVEPCLAVLLVGDDPASAVYVRGKARDCEECGIRSLVERLPANTTQEALLVRLAQLAAKAALEDRGYFDRCRNAIMDTREAAAKLL